MSEVLTDLFRCKRWANLRLIDACENLTDAQLDACRWHVSFNP